MTLGLNLLNSLWQKQRTGVTSLEMIQLINLAREKSLAKGAIYSLMINKEKKNMELALFNPEDERLASGIGDMKTSENPDKKKKSEVLFRSNIPPDIEDFYSTSGIKLSAPVLFLHFYPDGTSDSFIIKYNNRDKPWHFIPRNGGHGVFLTDINSLRHEH